MKKKHEPIKIKVKQPWEISRGHQGHLTGSGQHDNRPKRQRTRGAQRRAAMREWN